MEQDNKKRRTGQNIAFYTALAVCLTAVGVGTWQLLRPEGDGKGTAAVSSSVALPGADSDAFALPDGAADGMDGGTADGPGISVDGAADSSGSVTVSGGAAVASDGGAESGNGGGQPGSAVKNAESDAETVSAAASIPEDSQPTAKDTVISSDTKKTTDSKSTDGKSANSKTTTTDKATDSKAKDAKSGTASKADKLSGEVVRPVEGSIVTGFSMDKLLYNETMRDWRTHDGIDIAAEPGTAVVAARAGTVESVTADPIMGTTVTVRHAEKWESVYASLADMAEVEAGDDVTAGQVLGFVGETAASEAALGPHLHFSVLNDSVPVDPEAFLA